MKIIEIFENESISLDDEEICYLIQIKEQFPYLPFRIIDNKLITSDYIIGEIQFKSTLIRIKPRNSVLNLSQYFEMLIYIDKLNSNSIQSFSFSDEASFGVNGLVDNFIQICKALINFGLTGLFTDKNIKSFKPKGEIDFSKFQKKLIPIEGIPSLIDEYNIDNNANQIIKTALYKVKEYYHLSDNNCSSILNILCHFEKVSLYNKDFNHIKSDITSFYSSNPFYPIALEYSVKIILDFKLGYSSKGDTQWNAFLENSNDTFEKYIRCLLERELNHQIIKWEAPKKFAEIKWKSKYGEKSYSPDIIIDYINGKARAVFDVKNKYFSPKFSNLSELTSSADIYQLLFYSKQLNSDICALIYPSDDDYEPINVDITGLDIKFFLLSINMNVEFEKRKNSLIKNVNFCLNYS